MRENILKLGTKMQKVFPFNGFFSRKPCMRKIDSFFFLSNVTRNIWTSLNQILNIFFKKKRLMVFF